MFHVQAGIQTGLLRERERESEREGERERERERISLICSLAHVFTIRPFSKDVLGSSFRFHSTVYTTPTPPCSTLASFVFFYSSPFSHLLLFSTSNILLTLTRSFCCVSLPLTFGFSLCFHHYLPIALPKLYRIYQFFSFYLI